MVGEKNDCTAEIMSSIFAILHERSRAIMKNGEKKKTIVLMYKLCQAYLRFCTNRVELRFFSFYGTDLNTIVKNSNLVSSRRYWFCKSACLARNRARQLA